MSPPIDHRGKDDRLSLLKNLHRPNGQIDGGVHPYGQETFVQQPYNRQPQSRSSFSHFETEKIFCLRQQFLTAAAIIVVTSLVAFVLFVTTFR